METNSDPSQLPAESAPILAENAATGNPSLSVSDLAVHTGHSQPLTVNGSVLIGGMRQTRTQHIKIDNPSLYELLQGRDLPLDGVITLEAGCDVTILDADTHHITDKPSTDALLQVAVDCCAEAHWVSHGQGLKFVFVGPKHRERAISAAFLLPSYFTVELLQYTRHPGAIDSKRPDKRCSQVVFNTEVNTRSLQTGGALSPEDRQQLLERLGLADGTRFEHQFCPIDGEAESSAGACVEVKDDYVICYRCHAKDISLRPGMAPGIFPLSNEDQSFREFKNMAHHWVHWTQAKIVLRQSHSNLSDSLLREAYQMFLQRNTKEGDPRIAMAFSCDNNFLLTTNGWVRSDKGDFLKLSKDACKGLPYCSDPTEVESKDGGKSWKVHLNSPRCAALIDGRPQGYPKVEITRGLRLTDPAPGVYRHTFSAPNKNAPALLCPSEQLSLPECLSTIESAFPGISVPYLQVCLAAGICGECGSGMLPMVSATGPSGSGKTTIIQLAASFLGDQAIKLEISEDGEPFNRGIGASVAAGGRFLMLDEFARTRDLHKRLGSFLQLGSEVSWRRLYDSNTITCKLHAALFLTAINLPSFLTNSQEFNRRVIYIQLERRVGDWPSSCGGDVTTWASRNAENAHVANSLITHVWQLCREKGFHFGKVAEEFGLKNVISSEDADDATDVKRSLYHHLHSGGPQRTLFMDDNRFNPTWIDLRKDQKAWELLDRLYPLDDELELKKSMGILKNILEAEDWNRLLNIASPTIACELSIHGRRFALRFLEKGTARGHAKTNEQLPPLADAPSLALIPESPTTLTTLEQQAEAVLREGGLSA